MKDKKQQHLIKIIKKVQFNSVIVLNSQIKTLKLTTCKKDNDLIKVIVWCINIIKNYSSSELTASVTEAKINVIKINVTLIFTLTFSSFILKK